MIQLKDFFLSHRLLICILFATFTVIFFLSEENDFSQNEENKRPYKCAGPSIEHLKSIEQIIDSYELTDFSLAKKPSIAFIANAMADSNSVPQTSTYTIDREDVGFLTTFIFGFIKPFIEKRIDQYLVSLGFVRVLNELKLRDQQIEKIEIALGSGQVLMCGQTVKANIIGKNLKTHTSFDSMNANSPRILQIGHLSSIRGLELGIIGMKEGGERIIKVPESLSYIANNRNKKTDESADLEYRVKIVEVIKKYPKEVLKIKTIDSMGSIDTAAICGDQVLVMLKSYDINGDLISKSSEPILFKISDNTVPLALELGIIGMRKGGTRFILAPGQVFENYPHATEELNRIFQKNIKILEVKMIDVRQK